MSRSGPMVPALLSVMLFVFAGLLTMTGEGWSQSYSQANRLPDMPSQQPGLGASPGVAIPPTSSAQERGLLTPRHRNEGGAVCIRIAGAARAFTTNPNLFNHWIYAENTCNKRIRLRVCYFSTNNCIEMDVGGRERKEAILGTLPSIKDFRFEYRERF